MTYRHDYLILMKGEERYIFRYCPGCEDRLFEVLIEYSNDPRLSLNSEEVSSLINKIREALACGERPPRKSTE